MTRSERKLLINTSILGALLTLLVAALDLSTLLEPLELFTYDARAKNCQFFQPPPTDKLVHIDIDDASLEAIGSWPWHRSTMAAIVDEISRAGCKALAFDVIYSEPQKTRYEPLTDPVTGAPTTRPAPGGGAIVLTRPVNDDEIFAEALRKFGHAIVPVSLNLAQQAPPPSVYNPMVEALRKDPNLPRQDLMRQMVQRGWNTAKDWQNMLLNFIGARKEAIYERISKAVHEHPDAESLRLAILPGADKRARGEPVDYAFYEEYRRFKAVQSLRRFGRTIPAGLPRLLTTQDEQATVEVLSRAAFSTGFVDYIPLGDGTVRSVPLWADHRGVMFPQMGLSLACAMLGVNLRDVKLDADQVTLPLPGGRQVRIPVHMQQTRYGQYGMFMDIPWFGKSGAGAWETMYDYRAYARAVQHMPIVYIYDLLTMRQKIRDNNQRLRDLLIFVWSQMDETRAQALIAAPYDPEDPDAMVAVAQQTQARIDADQVIPFWKSMDPKDLTPDQRLIRQKILNAPGYLKQFVEQAGPLRASLQHRRDDLRAQLGGKAAIIGWIAVGAIADYVPTSLHPRCPGAVVHGVIFDSIMTGNFWTRAPYWVSFLAILLMGGVTTIIVARLAAWQSVLACTLLGVGYIVFNGIFLFDYRNLIVELAAPVVCSMTVWAGCTVARYIQETQERARVKRFFATYVDPAVVEYAVENGVEKLDAQQREITVVFTDLQGFTSIAEKLKEAAVPILNEYMGLMVPIVRKYDGYLNKLLGDGIMFIVNAPRDIDAHARKAVGAGLEMLSVMPAFNESLAQRGLPALNVRVGISSGQTIMGNAGPKDRTFSDYTALGDEVNLGSRLEGANKAIGTRVLVNQRARELCGDAFLFRPVGRIQVVGKTEGVMVFEAMTTAETATDQQKVLAAMTGDMVEAFMRADFDAALRLAGQIETTYGKSKLTTLYATLCRRHMETPPENFAGDISLSEK